MKRILAAKSPESVEGGAEAKALVIIAVEDKGDKLCLIRLRHVVDASAKS